MVVRVFGTGGNISGEGKDKVGEETSPAVSWDWYKPPPLDPILCVRYKAQYRGFLFLANKIANTALRSFIVEFGAFLRERHEIQHLCDYVSAF